MNRNTIIRIAIPKALYESVKSKVLNEAKKPAKKVEEAKKKPSAGLTKKAKSAIVKKAESGKNVGKGGFDKLAKKAAKEYGSKESGKKVAAAAMWKNKAKAAAKKK